MRGLNSAYTPPPRKAISGRLLDEVYDDVKTHVTEAIHRLQYLNIVIDESSNINRQRVVNISAHTKIGSLYVLTEDIKALRMSGENYTNWLKNHLLIVCNGDPKRINSVNTDTCATMRDVWERLRKLPEFKHIFTIGCDSHGMQCLKFFTD